MMKSRQTLLAAIEDAIIFYHTVGFNPLGPEFISTSISTFNHFSTPNWWTKLLLFHIKHVELPITFAGPNLQPPFLSWQILYIYIYIVTIHKSTCMAGSFTWPWLLGSGICGALGINAHKSLSGCPAMSPHKIPWLFPDISLTILWFSLTMSHIIGISLLP